MPEAKPSFLTRHYSEIICGCCFLTIFTNIGLASTSFSVYQPYIVQVPGVGHSGGSIVLAARLFASLVCMFFVARFYNRFDCRIGIFVSCCCVGTGFAVFSLADSLPGLCLGALFTGVGYGLGGMVAATLLIGRWFKTHVGMAAAIAALGSGVASMVLPTLFAHVIESVSLSASFALESGIGFAMGLVLLLLVRNNPGDIGTEPFDKPEKSAVAKAHKAAFKKDAADRWLGLVYIAMVCVGVCCVTGAGYFGILLTAEGFSPIEASGLIALSGASLAVGKLVNGAVFDSLGTRNGSLFFFLLMIAGFVLCCICGHSVLLATFAAVALGAGISLGTVGVSVWSLELAPEGRRVQTIKNFQIAYMVGALAFNFLPGIIAESTGSYTESYALMLVASILAAAIIVGVYWYAEHAKA